MPRFEIAFESSAFADSRSASLRCHSASRRSYSRSFAFTSRRRWSPLRRRAMIFEKVCALIAEQFNVDADSITMDTSFEDDLNADSVDLVDLTMALEEEFDIGELTEEDTASVKTVGDLVHFLQSKVD